LLYFSALLVMQVMGQRLQVTEQRQQQMMTFLAKAMQNPAFLAQLMQQSESNKRLAATVRKKRRLPKQDEGGEDSLNADSPPDGQMMYLMSQCCIFLLHQLYTSRDLKVRTTPLRGFLKCLHLLMRFH
jgi:heat shock transcription factor